MNVESLKALSILQNIEQENETDFRFTVYIEADKTNPVISQIANESRINKIRGNISFKDTLLQLPYINYDSILFLTTTFLNIGNNSTIKLIEKSRQFKSLPILDEILKPSFGYLLYAHQLEQLYCMITKCKYEDAIDFRKNWNKKKPDIRNAAKEIEVFPGFTLSELLQQRCIEENQFAFNANFNGAFLLWNYINKEYKNKI